jgi:pyridoxal phosphate enzyme (YggS family)
LRSPAAVAGDLVVSVPVTLQADIAARLSEIRDRIGLAAERVGRRAGDVRLVAVSKTYPIECVEAAADAGQRDFGENRVQEALQKMAAAPGLDVRWHLIGHLQSNKARKAAGPFAWVHSIDRVDLLLDLDRAALQEGAAPEALIQVDLAGEATKHGAPPDRVRAIADAAAGCRAVRLVGLMLLPPYFDDAEEARPYFERLRGLRDRLCAEGVPADRLRELSMGMSHDFEVAIEEGATVVRVGTAIFGARL